MIQTEGITKSFGSLQVLKGIDLTIGEGEIVAIVGPSGAGKTTLLQIIGTLDAPDSGKLYINGTETVRYQPPAAGITFDVGNAESRSCSPSLG